MCVCVCAHMQSGFISTFYLASKLFMKIEVSKKMCVTVLLMVP